MKLRLRSEDAAGICQIGAEGEIRSVEEPRDLRDIEEMLGPQCYRRKVLLDLQDSPHIDSSGVSWLVHFHKSSQTAGGMLILYSVPPGVMAVFKLLGMQQYFNLVADERAAAPWPKEGNHERRRTRRAGQRSPCTRQTNAASPPVPRPSPILPRARQARWPASRPGRVRSVPLTSPGCARSRPSPH